MKNFYLFLLPVLFLISTSCSKDDDNNSEEATGLAGEWQMEEFQYQGTTTVKQGENFDQSSYTGTAKDINVTMVFNELPDNTWSSSGSYKVELVSTVNGEVQTAEMPYPNITGEGSYSISGSLISIGYNQHEGALAVSEGTIKTLTENELILEFDYTETTTISGFEVDLVVEGFQRFSR